MKFSKNNKHSSVILHAFSKNFLFYLPESKKISVFIQKIDSIMHSKPVSNPIPEDGTNTGTQHGKNKIGLAIKASDYEHDLLSRYQYANNGKRLYQTRYENDNKVPVTQLNR